MTLLLLLVLFYSVSGYNHQQNAIITKYEDEGLKDRSYKLDWKDLMYQDQGPESKRYKPDWKDLDSRPVPEWYDRAKIGIFLHWGVYSVPGFKTEWFWKMWKDGDFSTNFFMRKNYPPGFTYQDFGPMFTAEFYNPDYLAELFKFAGAKYVVLTTKHHDGFALFPSRRSFGWNSMDVGPHMDLTGMLATAVRKQGMKFGTYHSLMEWYNPMYENDRKNNYTTQSFVEHKLRPDIEQIINDYKPSILWTDGDWEDPDTYWNATNTLAWLYNDSPVKDELVTIDRWGIGTRNTHGGVYTGQDHYHPDKLIKNKWEDAFSIDKKSWGYRRNMNSNEVWSIKSILENIVTAVSCGGNALVNIGLTKEGTADVLFEQRLVEMGTWLKINGEAIYDSSPWFHQKDSANNDTWYTCTKTEYNAKNPTAPPKKSDNVTAIYAVFFDWPVDNVLKIKDISSTIQNGYDKVQMLGQGANTLKYSVQNGLTSIELPDLLTVNSEYLWTLKFTHKYNF